MEFCCEYENSRNALVKRHTFGDANGIPDAMMSLKGVVGGPKKGQHERVDFIIYFYF
jgi:hypothetical protein